MSHIEIFLGFMMIDWGWVLLRACPKASSLLLEASERGEFADENEKCDVGGIGDECLASLRCSVNEASE